MLLFSRDTSAHETAWHVDLENTTMTKTNDDHHVCLPSSKRPSKSRTAVVVLCAGVFATLSCASAGDASDPILFEDGAQKDVAEQSDHALSEEIQFQTYPIAVDSLGRVYRIADSRTFYRIANGTVTRLATVDEDLEQMHGGGSYAFARGRTTIFRTEEERLIVGLRLPLLPNDSLTVDDQGNLYRNSDAGVFLWRDFESEWTWLSPAVWDLYVGGGNVYATDFWTQDISRYDASSNDWVRVGGPGAEFAVDASGTLYGLSPSRDAIYRLNNSGQWRWVGGPAAHIFADRRVAATNDRQVAYELEADGTWQYLGSDVLDIVTGGDTMLGLRTSNGTSHWDEL